MTRLRDEVVALIRVPGAQLPLIGIMREVVPGQRATSHLHGRMTIQTTNDHNRHYSACHRRAGDDRRGVTRWMPVRKRGTVVLPRKHWNLLDAT